MRYIFNGGFKVIQGFGEENTSPKYLAYYRSQHLKGHEGADLVPNNKDMDWRIYTPYSGIVVKVHNKCDNPYGRYITVWVPKLNIAVQFCHLKEVYVKVGQEVEKNQLIGLMGGTGYSEEAYPPHCHVMFIPVNNMGYRNGDMKNGYKGMTDPFIYLNISGVDVNGD